MTNNPRRANLTALNRTNTRTSFDDVSVINATALPRSVSYNVGSDRPMDSNFSKASRQAVSPSEDSRLKDSLSHDPFVSISRAINNVKLRAGSQLRTISANKYSRSSRYQPCYNVVQKLSRVITLAMMILIFIFLSFRKGAGTFSESNISFWDSMRKKPLNGRIESASAREALKHRASFSLNKFEAGPWVIGLIADLDKESCHIRERHDETSRASTCGSANVWVSYLKRGVLDVSYQVSPKSTFGRIDDVGLKWLDEIRLEGHVHSITGRGMELSELEWFFGHLLTPDDHTGKLLELLSPRGLLDGRKSNHLVERSSQVPPSTLLKSILHDGSGDDKNQFFKSEWMVVKDDKLYVGGHGRPYTDAMDGTKVKSHNPKWVKVVDRNFKVSHVNWTAQYDRIAAAAGVPFPGYLMHEAVLWSNERREWIFLPRRRSKEPFKDSENERKGWNTMLTASEDFKKIESVDINGLRDSTWLRGFSSAKFVPGTGERLIIALRTTEVETSPSNPARKTATYLSIFELPSGRVVLEEEKISDKKYEGIVFL